MQDFERIASALEATNDNEARVIAHKLRNGEYDVFAVSHMEQRARAILRACDDLRKAIAKLQGRTEA